MENQSKKNKKIVVGVCTFHRNQLLDGTLESLSRMNLPEDATVELVVVDNDENGGARTIFEDYQGIFPFESHYVIEPHQGIVHARNRVIEEALKLNATEIAYVDDDEIVSQQWLTALWEFYTNSFHTGACGPMYRLLPPGTDEVLLKFWPNFRERERGDECMLSTNNCLFSTNVVRPDKMNMRFDEFFNQIGGEDGAFALVAMRKGAHFAYVPEAITIERFTKKRATFKYLLKRHFGSGSLVPLLFSKILGINAYRRFLLPAILKLVWRAFLAPFSILFGRFQFWNNLTKLSTAAGQIIGCFGKSYKHYTTKNILAEAEDA